MLKASFITILLFSSVTAFATADVVIDHSPQATEARLTPPGSGTLLVDKTAQPAVAQTAAATDNPGQKIYNTVCATCHSSGVAGAPKKGDKAAWKTRMAAGWDTVMSRAVKGFKAMPAKGTCSTCTDADLKAAIEYMSQ